MYYAIFLFSLSTKFDIVSSILYFSSIASNNIMCCCSAIKNSCASASSPFFIVVDISIEFFANKVLSVIISYHTLQIEHERKWINHRRLITVLKPFENALYCSNATHPFCDFIDMLS